MTALGEMTLEDAAKQAAGNWQQFRELCVVQGQEITDPDNWSIIYTHNRDSGLLDQSNADQHRQGNGAVHGRRRPRCGDGIP